MKVHQLTLHLVYGQGRVFALQQSPTHIHVVAQIRIFDCVPKPQKRSRVRHHAVRVMLDGELHPLRFGSGQARAGDFDVTVPNEVPIETVSDIDVKFLVRLRVA